MFSCKASVKLNNETSKMNNKKNEPNSIPDMPLISVVMPCYNNGAYVAQAIESVQKQTFENWELVVVNDGSTDKSDEVISGYARTDKRIHYIKQENKGVSAARNHGVQAATGEYICFLDADDWFAPECLQKVVDNYQEYPECRLFYLKSKIVDENKGHRMLWIGYRGNYRNVLVYGMDVKIVIRKADFLQVGGFDEKMRSGFEDWEFNVRFLDNDSIVIVSETPLYYYRCYKTGKRVSDKAEQNKVEVQSYIYTKNWEKYVKCLGSPIMQYQYEDRFLPRLCRKILNLKAIAYNCIKR